MMYSLREATIDDIAAILNIARQTWWPTYEPLLGAEQVKYMLDHIYSAENIAAQITNNTQTYLILSDAGQAVAFAAYSPKEGDAAIFKLHKLYCLPLTQGKGYGKVLINTVAEKALEAGKHVIDLNVNRSNNAKNFYEKMGFKVAYEEDIAVGPYWMNDYVMRKEL